MVRHRARSPWAPRGASDPRAAPAANDRSCDRAAPSTSTGSLDDPRPRRPRRKSAGESLQRPRARSAVVSLPVRFEDLVEREAGGFLHQRVHLDEGNDQARRASSGPTRALPAPRSPVSAITGLPRRGARAERPPSCRAPRRDDERTSETLPSPTRSRQETNGESRRAGQSARLHPRDSRETPHRRESQKPRASSTPWQGPACVHYSASHKTQRPDASCSIVPRLRRTTEGRDLLETTHDRDRSRSRGLPTRTLTGS
jgi:hypothetical protein